MIIGGINMELNWSLKEIYSTFNSDEFKKDLENLTSVIEDINIRAKRCIKIHYFE